MPIAVRNRYEKLKESPSCPANIDMLIENFDKAVSHPNQNDLDKLIQELKNKNEELDAHKTSSFFNYTKREKYINYEN